MAKKSIQIFALVVAAAFGIAVSACKGAGDAGGQPTSPASTKAADQKPAPPAAAEAPKQNIASGELGESYQLVQEVVEGGHKFRIENKIGGQDRISAFHYEEADGQWRMVSGYIFNGTDAWMIEPNAKQAMKVSLGGKDGGAFIPPDLTARAGFTDFLAKLGITAPAESGKEQLGGVETTKYEIPLPGGGKRVVWVDQRGLMLKSETHGQDGMLIMSSILIELEPKTFTDADFAPPQDYQVMEMSIPSLMPGMDPSKMPQPPTAPAPPVEKP